MKYFMILCISLVGISYAKEKKVDPSQSDQLIEVQQNLDKNSMRVNLKKVQATLNVAKLDKNEGIPTQKSVYTIHLDWQKPSKCVDAISEALNPHFAWRLLQVGRDLAQYKLPKEEAERSLESLKKLAPTKVFVNHSDISYQIVNTGSRHAALDTLNNYYQNAIGESKTPHVVSHLAHSLDQLEIERNQVVKRYLELRLETQTVELNIECRAFAPPVQGEARVAVPWLNTLGVHTLERGF